jgi:tol-pal system protein YbgF
MRLTKTFFLLALSLAFTFPVAADQRLSDLVLQVQRLQEEVQQLRGRIELQRHQISTLEDRQREQYMDLDARLQGRTLSQSVAPDRAGAPQEPSEAPSQSVTKEKKAYQAAFDLLKQRRYDDAVRAFEDLMARYPKGQFADNASYWLGEAFYVQRDYSSALTHFQRVLGTYPLSPKVPGSMLKIGYIQYDQGDWQRARRNLQDVVSKFPDSTEARLARNRLERMAQEGH